MKHRFSFNTRQWSPDIHQWKLAYEAIQENERKRISQFVFKDDAKSSLIGRVLLRYMVCQLTKISWSELCLERSNKGKPVIDYSKSSEILSKKYPRVSVNVSHCGDYVVGVMDENRLVGVDVMDTRRKHGDISQFFGVMERTFTPCEWSCINGVASEDDRMRLFYRHWCLKESFVKAIGKGIGYSLQRLSFNVDSKHDIRPGALRDQTSLDIDNASASNWHFEETMIDENHCVAIATNVGEDERLCDVTSIGQNLSQLRFCDFKNVLMTLSPVSDDLWDDFDNKLSKNAD